LPSTDQGGNKGIGDDTKAAARRLAEAQTAVVGKQKNTFYGTRIPVPVPKFCEQLLPNANFTEIWQSAAEL